MTAAGTRQIAQLLAAARARLSEAGVPSPEWDAERLLRHVLGWDRARIVTEAGASVPPEAQVRFDALVLQRAMRVPLQHLVGRQAFWRHEFEVSGDALIPRPETELLVEEALRLLVSIESPLVLDVGTGTGCIALSIAAERPDARVFAGDISSRALAMATRNAHRIAPGRVAFIAADLLAAWAEAPLFDLILSNPPYAAASDAPSLAPEVRDHEPGTALFGGEDGLGIYRRLLPQSRLRLKPEGHLVLEIGMGQEDAVRTLAGACGLDVLRVLPDLQTIPRVLVAKPAS